jgi:hypothetical protein
MISNYIYDLRKKIDIKQAAGQEKLFKHNRT